MMMGPPRNMLSILISLWDMANLKWAIWVSKEEVFREVVTLVASLGIWRRIAFLQEALQIISQEDKEEVVVEGLLVGGSITKGKKLICVHNVDNNC